MAAICCIRPDLAGNIDLDNHLVGLRPELASCGLQKHVHYENRVSLRDTNWKMPIDTFLESYHIASLHREMERNYLSGALDEVLIGQNEPALAHFHRSLEQTIAEP